MNGFEMPGPVRRLKWPAFGAIVVGVALIVVLRPSFREAIDESSIAPLVKASAHDGRAVEPRLTGGFPWAPYRAAAPAAVSSTQDLRLASAAGAVLDRVRGQSTGHALHTAGVAHLLRKDPRQALASLEDAARSSTDAQTLSDLAVALYEVSNRYGAPELVADALAAADRALAADPRAVEPLFNRALFLEHLGLRDDAREAWRFYLARDGGSPWAAEARERLGHLAAARPFLEKLDEEISRRGAAASVRDLVRENPAEARSKTEMVVLGRWATAALASDANAAAIHLRVARAVGEEIAALNGDRSVLLSLAAIDAASRDERQVLASAHAHYEEGLKLFQSSRPVDAEPRLARAAELFGTTRSPMVWRARFFAGNTGFDQGRRDVTQRNAYALLGTIPEGFRAHRAELLWQLGACHASDAEWGEAIRNLHQSVALFEELGERRNVGSVRRMLAVVYDRIGDPASAWSHRMAALRVVGEHSGLPLEKAVASIAGAAILRGKWHTALSFLNVQSEISRRTGHDVQLADALLTRAGVHVRLGEEAAARADAVDAEAATARVKDPTYVAYGHAAQSLVKAMLARSPGEAVSLLTESIALQATRGDRMNLPGLYLQRARARRAMGEDTGAAADLETGITELERHRQSLLAGSDRWGAFFSASELFEEAIDLAMSRDDTARAFATAERARARALLDAYGVAPPTMVRPVGDAVIVEYVALPARLLIFIADERGVTTGVAVALGRQELVRQADAFGTALAADDVEGARRLSASLYRRLIEPVLLQLNASTVVFVPDATLAALPFNALHDGRGDYLLERHAIVIAPSAASFVAAAARRATGSVPESVAVLGNSAGTDAGGRLPFVDAEAQEVARAYPRAVRLLDEAADLESWSRALATVDVAHFAGHAIGDDSGLVPASMVLRRGGTEHRVTVPELAALRLRRPVTVVLAGCSTARGERRGTEGVMSVANGFLLAGAPAVVATLWPIDDRAAAVFFPRLHRRLAEGLSPAEALRRVQLDAIRDGDIPLSLWAAVIDIGS